MSRGYACVALHMPKTTANVGSAMRAAFCYDARLIVTSGQRYSPVCTDTMKAYRHIPFLQAEDVFEAIPYDCVPVAVDLLPGAIDLPRYQHPERAFYVFGPEDGTLGSKITDRCRDAIKVPTRFCMNLAATVNVILYDRLAKQDIKHWKGRCDDLAAQLAIARKTLESYADRSNYDYPEIGGWARAERALEEINQEAGS